MKRIVAFLLVISMLWILTACGSSAEEKFFDDSYINETQTSEATEENVADITNRTNTSSSKVSTDEAKQLASEYLIKTTTRYDKEGKIISISNYEYDEHFRCTMETYEHWDSFDSSYNFSYISLYEYDVHYGWLKQISIVENINNTITSDWTEYSYDSDGTSIETTYSDGKILQKTFYNKDKLAIAHQIYTENSTFYYTYDYDKNGDVVLEHASKTNSDGSVYNWGDIHYEYEYTPFGLKSKKMNINNGEYTTYEYDNNYCLVKINHYSPSFVNEGKTELNGWTEYEYVSKSNVLASIENEKQESEDRKEVLINEIKKGTAYSSYEELFSLTKTLDSDDMDRFRGEWYREDGSSIKVGLIGHVEMECYDGDRKAVISGVLQYVSANIAMFGCEIGDGIGYILFDYNNNSVNVYSLLAVNGNKKIAGTYKTTIPNISETETSKQDDVSLHETIDNSQVVGIYRYYKEVWDTGESTNIEEQREIGVVEGDGDLEIIELKPDGTGYLWFPFLDWIFERECKYNFTWKFNAAENTAILSYSLQEGLDPINIRGYDTLVFNEEGLSVRVEIEQSTTYYIKD